MRKMKASMALYLFLISIAITSTAAWVTHVVYCIQNQEYLFLIAGALVAPVGAIHGFGLWFGIW